MMNIVKITDYMSKDLVSLDLKAGNKTEVLEELSTLIGKSDTIIDNVVTHKALVEREELGSTGIGKKVAIPHAKTDAAEKLTIAFGISRKGVDFASLDEEDVKMFFVFASPLKDSQIYLKVLARISRLIRNEEFRNKLLAVKTPEEVLECIEEEENI
ncbi:PTS sugar transporter subunit IIA [uncultured Ilyobacter sp.]|uniref:PTS sugar transporter subunit IIA n=1 Tax=uncultured Ilyobacter sp. TaxID=544433 RepID=UPI0029F59004|nr:PTS sugar transporter subunit IIA [uncultured Ilyobacter sp.]